MSTAAKTAESAGWLFVIPWALEHVGGVNEVVRNLHDYMKINGTVNPGLLVQSWPDKEPRSTVENGREVSYLRVRSPRAKSGIVAAVLAYLLHLPADLIRLRRFLVAGNTGAINVHYPTMSLLTFVLLKWLRLFRGQLIVSLHGTDLSQIASAGRAERTLWSWMMARVDVVVACSSGLRDRAEEALPRLRDRVRVIHNGVDVSRTEAAAGRGAAQEA